MLPTDQESHFKSILSVVDRSTFFSILLISLFINLLALVVPVAAQILVNMIAFTKLMQPVLTISIIVFIVMIGVGLLNVWLAIIIETLQQKLVVKVGLDLAYRLPKLDCNELSNINRSHGPDLVNRFFDLIAVKKALSKLMVYGVNLVLQVLMGMTLLLFYHPLLLAFNIILLGALALALYFPYHTALKTAHEECSRKHEIAAWLQEILKNEPLFKLGNNSEYALQETDRRLVNFLKTRNLHFRALLEHLSSLYFISAMAGGLLLGLGGYLVINNQLSLGQLVAAEIVLGALIYAFDQISALLSDYYDLRAGTDEVDAVMALPIEKSIKKSGFNALPTSWEELSFHFIDFSSLSTEYALHYARINATASASQPLLIVGQNGRGKSRWINALLGLTSNYTGEIKLNHLSCNPIVFLELRQYTALIRDPELFDGSIYENLTLANPSIELQSIYNLLELVGLADTIINLPQNIHTKCTNHRLSFTQSDLIKLMFVRAIIAQPKLLLVDCGFDDLDVDDVKRILNLIAAQKHITLIATSNQNHLIPLFPNKVVL